MARLRPIDTRRRKPSWFDDDLPPAPLGTSRAHREAQRDFQTDYETFTSEEDDRGSPSYRRPAE